MTSFNHETPSQEELEKSNRWFKSATPKYTFDWYVKWISSIIILAAMSIRGVEGLQLYDIVLSIIGSLLIVFWIIIYIAAFYPYDFVYVNKWDRSTEPDVDFNDPDNK